MASSLSAAPPCAQHCHASAGASRRSSRCAAGRPGRSALRVRAAAADDLCRDKVSSPQDLKGESSTRCVVNFKGADGKVLPVEMPEVWQRLSRSLCGECCSPIAVSWLHTAAAAR